MHDNTEKLMPELKDILNRIQAFNVSHPEGRFIYAFLGFKKMSEIVDYEDAEEYIDENKTMIGGYGYLDELRGLCNDLRDNVEDNVDSEGFVNF